jgi:hypothetical protein
MQVSSVHHTRSYPTPASERRFFALLSIAILIMAVAGFLRTYIFVPALGLPAGALAPTTLVHIHAMVFFSWCALLVVQSWFVVSHRTSLHRKAGLLGFALYGGLIVTGPIIAVRATIRNGSTPDELAFLAVGLSSVLAYAVIFGAAFYWRRRPDIHKRLMMVGMVVLLTAPFGRLSTFPYLLEHVIGPGVVVAALVIWDYSALGRLHIVSAVVGPMVLLWALIPNLYMNSTWWLGVARWLVNIAA